ncbi:MAG: hypothetical protein JWP22_4207 [Ramlibacter sp.]|nr:hypothetical protein [Ramlibacter sp.]MDB5915532.1 hypothetical protein [Ramlibacter sp.]
MSFLNHLKSQARALQSLRTVQEQHLEERVEATEKACRLIAYYFEELAQQLTVIQPPGPNFTVDGKTPWPAMRLVGFTADARRKRLRDHEVYDYVALGWSVAPKGGEPVMGVVVVNFPTDMKRVEERLGMGLVQYDREEVRIPDKNVLKEVHYKYRTQTRGSVTATADHEQGLIHFRLANTHGFEVVQTTFQVSRIGHELLDELAKRVMAQPSVFL